MSRCLTICLALLAVGAPAAQARNSEPAFEATTRAVAYWHARPCAGHWKVENTEAAPLSSDPEGIVDMWATWAPGPTDCVVHLNPEVWPSATIELLNFRDFCQGMVHEFGHFLGHTDAAGVPGTVTSREALAAPTVAPCRHYRLRFGHEWLTG